MPKPVPLADPKVTPHPALEKLGHPFARYADDFIILVKSQRAGERVLKSITRFIENRLSLVINSETPCAEPHAGCWGAGG